LFCQECPKRPLCSQPCPEAEAYANQDITPQREFFHLSAPQYKKPLDSSIEEISLTKIEWKILTLSKKNLSRKEICKILGISRENLRVRLSLLRSKFNGLPPFFG
jgi:DNA-binding NarL/FixJ family response regulator